MTPGRSGKTTSQLLLRSSFSPSLRLLWVLPLLMRFTNLHPLPTHHLTQLIQRHIKTEQSPISNTLAKVTSTSSSWSSTNITFHDLGAAVKARCPAPATSLAVMYPWQRRWQGCLQRCIFGILCASLQGDESGVKSRFSCGIGEARTLAGRK